jgi:hypothetical protein
MVLWHCMNIILLWCIPFFFSSKDINQQTYFCHSKFFSLCFTKRGFARNMSLLQFTINLPCKNEQNRIIRMFITHCRFSQTNSYYIWQILLCHWSNRWCSRACWIAVMFQVWKQLKHGCFRAGLTIRVHDQFFLKDKSKTNVFSSSSWRGNRTSIKNWLIFSRISQTLSNFKKFKVILTF